MSNRLDNANKTLQESLDKVVQALAILDTDVWQGKSKESAVSVMLILKEYHEKILSVAEDNEGLNQESFRIIRNLEKYKKSEKHVLVNDIVVAIDETKYLTFLNKGYRQHKSESHQ